MSGVLVLQQSSPRIVEGSDLNQVGAAVGEQFTGSRTLDLIVGLTAPMTDSQVAALQTELRSRGLAGATVQSGQTDEWPHAVLIRFSRPTGASAAVIALPVLIIGALGAVGIVTFLGFKVAEGFSNIGQSIADNLIPLTLIGAGVWLASRFFKKQPA